MKPLEMREVVMGEKRDVDMLEQTILTSLQHGLQNDKPESSDGKRKKEPAANAPNQPGSWLTTLHDSGVALPLLTPVLLGTLSSVYPVALRGQGVVAVTGLYWGLLHNILYRRIRRRS